MNHAMKYLKAITVCVSILCGVASSSSAVADESKALAAPTSGNACLKVTISVFSGRPDPVFMVCDEATLDNIRSDIAFSQVNNTDNADPVLPARLGYRGIIVENINNVFDMPKYMAMNGGDIEVADTNQRVYLLDDGQLEETLINEAFLSGAIDQEIFDYIQEQR